ncbi:MAG: response regulator transcription factor [Oscillospiraceae bacterium]|nr:response regulator transcription factor [Oscillospiraceae bacterium]MBP1554080.1 response regulator transcription factor [Oscillospiraceae bacterium]MBP1571707.1 response regulator transcription factor [Oscillospiraceae bacterium]MBQ5312686.1 response regulator transcription factor [Oscillospiraceae bacterium]MBQ5325236.1 response regulator transcription factor [Oscillospiraceae bacterium]
MKILVVDDEPKIRELIGQYLTVAGYETEFAKDGIEALNIVTKGDIDLVILDVMMPFMDGITCLKEMRSRGFKTPVIILSAKGEEYDKITGFEAGTDDYVVKPFSPKELMARVKAVAMRANPELTENNEKYIFGDLVIDVPSHSIKIKGEYINVTPKEFDLLVCLVQNKGVALSRERILLKVWNYDYFGEDRTVDTHIKMLRSHLKEYRDCIETVWGVGYKFEPKE